MFLCAILLAILSATPVEPVPVEGFLSTPATFTSFLVMVLTLVTVSGMASLTSVSSSSGSDISSDEDQPGPNLDPQPGSEVQWGFIKTGKSVEGR